ncbi:hypothetical protein CI109_104245 [Kwoniella shandongensis]|uniref:Uncharacterized protein n=1 Tax=Kwoniella shandongensis TaxID=1734106 RepID=A0A5M6C1V0_9TREE|nr:uncharacterized protein CI109_002849 [Kwoniella shandongensis]KAA5528691.1 hypothetical protein CI109_002849 [Kwoniella shandongensis]
MTVPSQPEAGPSTSLVPGPSPFHETSQFRHWRYSPSSLAEIREELNKRSVEVVARNTELEKEAQQSLGHEYTTPPSPTTYLTVTDELLLLRFYCSQISKICRHGFGLPEVVESTAISYLKRFYLKNSVMEWHPKNIMPTCLFLAAKTTNYPVLIDTFISKFSKLTPADVLDTEFLVAQSLGFEFWVRGGEKALRGWSLDMQNQPHPPFEVIQKALPIALTHLSTSLLTDAEFIYTPSQISLACLRLANKSLVDTFLDERYTSLANSSSTRTSTPSLNDDDDDDVEKLERSLPYGIEKSRLLEILEQIEQMIESGGGELDLKKVKDVDKRLKQCTNPEKIPGTALYIKRKQEKEVSEAAAKAAKTLKAATAAADRDMVFGDIIQTQSRKPLSPRVTVPLGAGGGGGSGKMQIGGGEVEISDSGMGIRGESGGMLLGGKGLKDVGLPLSADE